MKRLLVALLCVAVMITACNRDKSAGKPVSANEKNPAPAISLISMKGSTLDLTSLKGKVVMLNFWATWCPPCREEIPSMMKLNKAMEGKPFQMICVSVDDGGKAAVEKFFSESGFYLPTYFDASRTAQITYGITGVPETFIIDKNGIIVKKVIGGLDWSSADIAAFLEGLMK
jgi:cytochrome c biogenesis protein CcmG, thiol:disulfide interchange protein DsbE